MTARGDDPGAGGSPPAYPGAGDAAADIWQGAGTARAEPTAARARAGGGGALTLLARLPRLALRAPILVYRYTLSSFMGRQCRYLPTCSEYADEAISRHGAWAGGWMGAARICRCHPWGGHGFDPVPRCLPVDARWDRPWRYGIWRAPPETGAREGADESASH